MNEELHITPKNGEPSRRAAGAAAAAARQKASEHDSEPDADVQKGSVEDEQPRYSAQTTPTTLAGQLGHRTNTPESPDPQSGGAELKENDTDFPEPGSSPEHSGQHR